MKSYYKGTEGGPGRKEGEEYALEKSDPEGLPFGVGAESGLSVTGIKNGCAGRRTRQNFPETGN